MSTAAREHDVVVYGATGFVGVLTAKYLAENAPPEAKIALGGRSQAKLERVRAELGIDWPLVVADSADPAAVAALAESTRVVASTVGPYFKYGKPLVEACAAAGPAPATTATSAAAATAAPARILFTRGRG